MKIIIVLLICGLAYVIATDPNKQCNNPHEVFSRCEGHCGKTCENRDQVIMCTKMCKPGCVCDDGWVKHQTKGCVTVDQCDDESNPSDPVPLNEDEDEDDI